MQVSHLATGGDLNIAVGDLSKPHGADNLRKIQNHVASPTECNGI